MLAASQVTTRPDILLSGIKIGVIVPRLPQIDLLQGARNLRFKFIHKKSTPKILAVAGIPRP